MAIDITDTIPPSLPSRKRRSSLRISSNPRLSRIRNTLGKWGLIIFILSLILAQFVRFYVIRTGHCDLDGCLAEGHPRESKNLTYEGECSLCRNFMFLDQFLIDSEEGQGVRRSNLRVLLFTMYLSISSYLFMSMGAFFYNPNFLLIYLLIQTFILIVFALKILVNLRETNLLGRFVLCEDAVCSVIWVTIYVVNCYFFLLAGRLTVHLDPLRRFNVLKEEFKSVLGSIQENWVTRLTDEPLEQSELEPEHEPGQ